MTAIKPRPKTSLLLDLKGRTFGSLFVMHKAPLRRDKKVRWKCRCVCQVELVVRHDYLLHTNSPKTHCGCLNKGNSTLFPDMYHIHNAMIQRCTSPKHIAYKSYGGRGITVCERWANKVDGFENFMKDMGRRPSKDYSLDRIESNGNYEPGNVQWATDKHQARNKRKSLYLPHPVSGESIPAAEVAEILGISYQQLRYRYIKEGKWPLPSSSQSPLPGESNEHSTT